MTDFPINLLRRDLVQFAPYRPSSVTLADMDRIVKLDSNENPYGPSPKTLAALADRQAWNRYAVQDELRPLIANYVGVAKENIVVGNGADEVIDLVQRIFLERGDAVVDCPPSFDMYGKYATINGARVIEVPRCDDFSIDVPAIERAVEREQPKLIFLATPNNPDGSLAPRQAIERLLALPAVLVLDEAYAEFARESFAREVLGRPNLVVLRTFSKWAGLAGLRVGYGIAPPGIAEQILRTKSPYNVNVAAIVAARAALEDVEYLRGNVRRIVTERERLSAALARTGFLEPMPTSSNFILCQVIGRDARQLKEALAERGILIRSYSSARLSHCVRISVGTLEQDELLLQVLKEIGLSQRGG